MADYEYIDDFGEKIGGARKDMWAERAMSTTDVRKMTVKELDKFVGKELIWSEPDLDSLLDDGRDKEIVLYIYEVYNSLKRKPTLILENREESDIRDDAFKYIRAIETVRDTCMNMMHLGDERQLYNTLISENYMTSWNVTDNCTDSQAFTKRTIELARKVARKTEYLKQYCEIQQFPENYTKELREIEICKTYSSNEYYIRNKGKIIENLDRFKSYNEALEYIQNDYLKELACAEDAKKKTKEKSIRMKIVRPQLDKVVRTGPDLRKGQEITGETMQKVFCIRAGEFGKWNNQEDRQACLNYSYDAMCDLAYALGFKRKALSLGKEVFEGKSVDK